MTIIIFVTTRCFAPAVLVILGQVFMLRSCGCAAFAFVQMV